MRCWRAARRESIYAQLSNFGGAPTHLWACVGVGGVGAAVEEEEEELRDEDIAPSSEPPDALDIDVTVEPATDDDAKPAKPPPPPRRGAEAELKPEALPPREKTRRAWWEELFGEDFVASVWTSVWAPTRINRIWVRCPSCGALEDVSDDHRGCSECGAPLPERPAFW